MVTRTCLAPGCGRKFAKLGNALTCCRACSRDFANAQVRSRLADKEYRDKKNAKRRMRYSIRHPGSGAMMRQKGYLYRRGSAWYGRVRIKGRDFQRSLRTASKTEARTRLEQMLKDAERYGGGSTPRHYMRRQMCLAPGCTQKFETHTTTVTCSPECRLARAACMDRQSRQKKAADTKAARRQRYAHDSEYRAKRQLENRERQRRPENKERNREAGKKWRTRNRERLNLPENKERRRRLAREYHIERMATDVAYRDKLREAARTSATKGRAAVAALKELGISISGED